MAQFPINGDDICMVCRTKPADEEKLTCNTCVTPWHVACLSDRPLTLTSTINWTCPDCTAIPSDALPILPAAASQSVVIEGAGSSDAAASLVASIRAIEADNSISDQEKAKRRQALMTAGRTGSENDQSKGNGKRKRKEVEENDILEVLDSSLNCSFCMQLPDRPVTTPCGHNFCLKCFQKWIGQGKRTCAKCRSMIPHKMASDPRINSTLVVAIRMAKLSRSNVTEGSSSGVNHFVHDQNRPDHAFTTERAQRSGLANAKSGKIFVTTPRDHFGPITAEYDPRRLQGVLVGESWKNRYGIRQWGVHLPHIAGIAGQSKHGAQSVVLSGGYLDDEDHGEWFLYTGSGGRDLQGNKRTNKDQSKDQVFQKYNEALRVSCQKGYPVRVVRSGKEKRSPYAPSNIDSYRYDGIYRVEKCWRKVGLQGTFAVCRYLFVRCDNDPAPWTSDVRGDQPRPFPEIAELNQAMDITDRKESPSWDYDDEEAIWKWKKPPPPSQKSIDNGEGKSRKKGVRKAKNVTNVTQKLLKEFSCLLCRQVLSLPVTTPCAHNFCKACLEKTFSSQPFLRERTCNSGRTLRSRKSVRKCPSCPTDISDFLLNLQVNIELKDIIESLQQKTEENNHDAASSSKEDSDRSSGEESDSEDEESAEMEGVIDDGHIRI